MSTRRSNRGGSTRGTSFTRRAARRLALEGPRRVAGPSGALHKGRTSQTRHPPEGRHGAVVLLFLAGFVCLSGRTGYLAVTERDFLKEQGEARSVREVTIPSHRGMIFDRNGEPLAVSAPMGYAWVDPQQTRLSPADLQRLANVLGLTPEVVEQRYRSGSKRFAYLARRLAPNVVRRVTEAQIEGVRIGREYHRFYPAGETTAHLVGRTNIDDVGQEGVELAFDSYLAGAPGAKRVLRDRSGGTIKDLDYVRDLDYLRAPKFGRDVELALDLRLQYLAYRELKTAVERNRATSGSLVMLDADSGEVLALANQPSFNPNAWHSRGVHGVRNRAIADLYEPGSTVKPLTVLAALEAGTHTPETEIDTHPGYLRIGGKTIEDPSNRGRITVSTALAKSSQVAISKMALAMSERAVFDAFQRAGFGDYTGCDLPGEEIGLLSAADLDKPIGRATLAYGYGVMVTPMQIARAYLMLANDGIRTDLTILRDDVRVRASSQPVFARRDAEAVAEMMRGVLLPGGTAPRARPASYTAAGKTGTARKVNFGAYDERAHVAFFAGFAPAVEPRIVLVVVINEPRGVGIGGGTVAAPVFAAVVERALRILGVPPNVGSLAGPAAGARATERPT
ncbi:MAG: penicillin-binding protein 2 [Gammaproteobacteria bacterium]|nr:penicillin-binding protein 2 [Gammaproteobacteria bacterium]